MNRRLFLAPLEGEKDSTVVRRRPLSPFPESSRVIAVADGIAATLCNSNTTAGLNTVSSFPERGIHAAVDVIKSNSLRALKLEESAASLGDRDAGLFASARSKKESTPGRGR